MDSRHQSVEQETLNELIQIINQFARDNVDALVSNDELRDMMRNIAKNIYYFADQVVEVDEILGNKNLLSIDAVLLPQVEELMMNGKDFSTLLGAVEAIVSHPSADTVNEGFEASVQSVLNKVAV